MARDARRSLRWLTHCASSEVSRRQGNDGRDYYDYKILGLCPPASVGQIYTAGE